MQKRLLLYIEFKALKHMGKIFNGEGIVRQMAKCRFSATRGLLQNNLKKISTWCNNNLPTINVKKSHWMKTKVCGEADTTGLGEVIFKVCNKLLSEVSVYKYLGLHIDSNFKFPSPS